MDGLIEEAWCLYHDSLDIPSVVRPSIPILFFGDSEQYYRSPLKVITVGLNPSRNEFPECDCFFRFPRARHVYPGILHGERYADYLAALNDYFRCYPYRQWFDSSFESLLNGLETSYYDGRRNTALHTDLCSPLATNPTWSGLKEGKARLEADGLQLWLRLARPLAPDVILISVAQDHLAKLNVPPPRDWDTIYTIERANPYLVKARELEIVPEKRTLIVFGRAAEKPFGTVSASTKHEIGRRVLEHFHGR
jgi:hypothetical protein